LYARIYKQNALAFREAFHDRFVGKILAAAWSKEGGSMAVFGVALLADRSGEATG
jgi:hypothetical protein